MTILLLTIVISVFLGVKIGYDFNEYLWNGYIQYLLKNDLIKMNQDEWTKINKHD